MIPTHDQIKQITTLPYYQSIHLAIAFREEISKKMAELSDLAKSLELVMIHLSKLDPPSIVLIPSNIVCDLDEDKETT